MVTHRMNVQRIASPLARLSGTLAAAALLALGMALVARLASAPPAEVEFASYSTSLARRTAGQRHNARLAAEAIDGRVIGAGAEFSFNRTVRSWSVDRGYVKAPVSFEGELVPAFGGGVCQTSTTLYNAALLAGLPIIERHKHVFAAHYAPPGRDAAVAQPNIDLRFRNPYPWPIRIHASAPGERLEVAIAGKRRSAERAEITTRVMSVAAPERLTVRVRAERGFPRTPGTTGYRVATYRAFYRDGRETRRERLSEDTYPPLPRVVSVTSE
jgi:vancomycin resistance protein VanW